MGHYQKPPELYDGLRLHQNENTGGCSPLVIEALSTLRPDQIGLGLPSSPDAANSGYVDPSVVNAALDCLAKGTSCGSFHPPAGNGDAAAFPGQRHSAAQSNATAAARDEDVLVR